MFDRKQTIAETDARKTAPINERLREDAFRADTASSFSQWNSWGERNGLSLGSYGRW